MLDDSADDDKFSNIALCVCRSAESINASEDALTHIQVSMSCYLDGNEVISLLTLVLTAQVSTDRHAHRRRKSQQANYTTIISANTCIGIDKYAVKYKIIAIMWY